MDNELSERGGGANLMRTKVKGEGRVISLSVYIE